MYTDKISGILTRKELCIDASEDWSRSQQLCREEADIILERMRYAFTASFTCRSLTCRWARRAHLN